MATTNTILCSFELLFIFCACVLGIIFGIINWIFITQIETNDQKELTDKEINLIEVKDCIIKLNHTAALIQDVLLFLNY